MQRITFCEDWAKQVTGLKPLYYINENSSIKKET